MSTQREGYYTNESGRNFRNSDPWFQSIKPPHGLVGIGDEVVGLDVNNESFRGSHFAVFPSALVKPFLLACTSARGCCPKCMAPWRRVMEKGQRPIKPASESKKQSDKNASRLPTGMHSEKTTLESVRGKKQRDRSFTWSRNGIDGGLDSGVLNKTMLGWRPDCTCSGLEVIEDQPTQPSHLIRQKKDTDEEFAAKEALHAKKTRRWKKAIAEWRLEWKWLKPEYDRLETVPCVILDPFGGAGTVGLVAQRLNRRFVLIELSEKYAEMARKRIASRGNVAAEPKAGKPKGFF